MHDLTLGRAVSRIGQYLVSVTPEDLQCNVFKQNHFRWMRFGLQQQRRHESQLLSAFCC